MRKMFSFKFTVFFGIGSSVGYLITLLTYNLFGAQTISMLSILLGVFAVADLLLGFIFLRKHFAAAKVKSKSAYWLLAIAGMLLSSGAGISAIALFAIARYSHAMTLVK